MELIVDHRESDLMQELERRNIPYQRENLPIGDVLIKHQQSPILLIERKTVRDLIASLRDGRYHNQRERWKEFQTNYEEAQVSLWVEGDLIGCYDANESLKSSLMNSLLRLQSIHKILVYQIKNNAQFVQSLKMLLEKFEKDPTHLQPSNEKTLTTLESNKVLDLKPFKKTTDVSPECVWRSTLCLIPGVSATNASQILTIFPTLKSLLLEEDPIPKLENLKIGKRKLGKKLAERIVALLCV